MTMIGIGTGRRLAVAIAATAAGLCALAGTAAAATAPTAITGPLTAVSPTTATVTGVVNPNGTTTTWYFDYGTSSGYGSKTAVTSVGAGSANSGVSSTVAGLAPGTTYHYRLVATNGGGTTQGADGIFTTPSASSPGASTAPAAVTGSPANVTAGSATLTGTVNPRGHPTTYYFEYGTTTGYGVQTAFQSAGSGTGAVSESASVSGLQSGQAYHFRIVATSEAGTTDGADVTFTPGGVGPTGTQGGGGPTVTTTAASSLTSSSAVLNGVVNPRGQATTWYFDYGPTTSYGSRTPVANVGSGTRSTKVSATVNGLPAGVFHFRLVGTSPAGTTLGKDLTFGIGGAPIVQTGTSQGAGTASATLTGSVNPLGNPTTWYFEYGPTITYGSKTPRRKAGSGTTITGVSAAIANLSAGSTYHYRLVATSRAGTSYGGDVAFMTVAAVTLASSTTEAVYAHPVILSGMIASRQAGVTVTIQFKQYGANAFKRLGTTVTTAGGTWTFRTRPRILTAYQATVPSGTSTPAAIGVRPAISLRVITGARLTTRTVAAVSLAGKKVQLQRLLSSGNWKTVATTPLNAKGSAIFAASLLPHGSSTIRVAMSVNQAGAGYLGSYSRSLTYKRK